MGIREIVTGIGAAALTLLGVVITTFTGERTAKRANRVAERSAAATEAQGISQLSVRVIDLTQMVERLDRRVASLEGENASLTTRLHAALGYITALIPWVAAGATAPAPQPPAVIAAEVNWPASWLHPTGELPTTTVQTTVTVEPPK